MIRVFISGLRTIEPESLRWRVFMNALPRIIEKRITPGGQQYSSFSVEYRNLEGTPGVTIEYPGRPDTLWAARLRSEIEDLLGRCPFQNSQPTLEVRPVSV